MAFRSVAIVLALVAAAIAVRAAVPVDRVAAFRHEITAEIFPAGHDLKAYRIHEIEHGYTRPDLCHGKGIAKTERVYFQSPVAEAPSGVCILFPPEPAPVALIVANGHQTELSDTGTQLLVDAALERGLVVLIGWMPQFGLNYRIPEIGDHDDMAKLERPGFNPMALFLHHYFQAISYLEDRHGIGEFYMSGPSGGAWTTLMVAAMDERVRKGFGVSGSYPVVVRELLGTEHDYEQGGRPGTMPYTFFRETVGFEDLYVLAGSGGRHYWQVMNHRDTSAYGGGHWRLYEKHIANMSRLLYGRTAFSVFEFDEPLHGYTPEAVGFIMGEVAGGS